MPEFHKPSLPGSAMFESLPGEDDPAERTAAGHRIANLLVRGAHDPADQDLVDRVLHLADSEGLGTIAELWSQAPAETVAGALWRLYALRTWVYRNPLQAAREFATGRAYAPVQEVLAGVVDPPGPDEGIALVDTVVRGILATSTSLWTGLPPSRTSSGSAAASSTTWTRPAARASWTRLASFARQQRQNAEGTCTELVRPLNSTTRRTAVAPGPKISRYERPRAVRRSRSGAPGPLPQPFGANVVYDCAGASSSSSAAVS